MTICSNDTNLAEPVGETLAQSLRNSHRNPRIADRKNRSGIPDDQPVRREIKQDLDEYDGSTMPLHLPETVSASRVRAGYPLGKIGDKHHTCRGDTEAKRAGYYHVDHPTGVYCERIE